MTRFEIHRRALRAAAAVSLTLGLAACASNVVVGPDSDGDEPNTTASSGGGSDSSTVASTASAGGDGSTSVATGAGGAGGAAAGPCADVMHDWQAYAACCDENGWAVEAGCVAWGPPVPPSLEMEEVA
ncbi:hypothetical protein [Polyangium sp. y55x31]|uniref:hypothetical protein n=1 Tax=Polyangium sp. y55x31 TaxID=3042688 RepID=UPI0024832A2B|nr:hypothetical protein [Polyangium sp. y55x31]MDI1480130.1 hypothetical protein [Polyangium sp. y55x31]